MSRELISSSISIYEDAFSRKNKMIKQAVLDNQAFDELELERPGGSSLQCAISLANS